MKDESEKPFLMRNPRRHIHRKIDTLSTAPSYPWGKWLGGVGVALWLCIRGINFVVKHEAVWRGRRGPEVTLHGTDALLLGVIFICAGIFCHFHFFWGNVECLVPFHHAGKTLSALVFVCVMGWLFWRLFASWGL